MKWIQWSILTIILRKALQEVRILNVFFNVFYALFSALSFVAWIFKNHHKDKVSTLNLSMKARKLDDYFNQYFSYAVSRLWYDKGIFDCSHHSHQLFSCLKMYLVISFHYILENGVLKT